MELSAIDVALQALATQGVKLIGLLVVGYGLMGAFELLRVWLRR